MLSFSGLPADQIEQRNVKVGEFKGKDVYIHTLILGDNDESKPVLVLCHGYGGSGALFYKIMQPLVSKFRLIMFDIIGMGGSSRPGDFNENKFSADEALDYIVEYVEKWRVAMGLERFYLSAHSFGGFVCGNYAMKYPQYVIKLLMISPIGVRYDPEWEKLSNKEKTEKINERFKNNKGRGPPAWARALATWGWNKKISPFSFARFVGRRQTLKAIERYVERRQKVDNGEQSSAVRDYMYQIFMRKGTTEYALMLCFELGFYCKVTPLGNPTRLPSLEVPITFIYGDDDWVYHVEQNAGKYVIDSHPDPNSKYYIVPHAGHNLHMDNPIEFAHVIINDLIPDANMPVGIVPEEQHDFQSEFLEDV